MGVLRAVVMLVVMGMLTGCAVGVTHRYDSTLVDVQVKEEKLALGVVDRRPYVISKDKPETFVGLSRGGFGNPFDVNTMSGQPLATDMGRALEDSLAAKGTTVNLVAIPAGASRDDAIKALAASGTKSVLVSLAEWKSDTFQSVALVYDVHLMVLDPRGETLADKRITGRDNLGSGGLNPPAYSGQVVPAAFQRKMEELFSSPGIADAL